MRRGGDGGREGDAGDERGFEELLVEHMDALFAMALRLAEGDEAEAEDVLQEAAIKAYRGFGDLEDPSAGRAWLFTILTRTHLNRVRSKGRRVDTPESALESGELEAALAAWDPVRSPEEEFAGRQLRDRLLDALDALPEEQRMTVWLVDVEGFSHREAARMLDVAEGTVASRLYRARHELRGRLLARGRQDRFGRTGP